MSVRSATAVFLLAALLGTGCGVDVPTEVQQASQAIPEQVSFSLHVRPILSDRCFSCHGPDAEGRVTNLRFDTEEGMRVALTESRRSRAVRGGNPGGSELVHRILSDDPLTRMPPPESNLSLSTEEKAILIRWIEQGADYEEHWAFSPPTRPALPTIDDEEWPRDNLDRFVLAR
ncbi:MAG: hypothetical protein O2899_05100, partial [Bacteroidetes bacterium]|nr:hypothetical protein [Bacteroidota bacterium]